MKQMRRPTAVSIGLILATKILSGCLRTLRLSYTAVHRRWWGLPRCCCPYLEVGTVCPNLSRPHPLWLFTEVASRLSSSGVHSHEFCRNFCSACAVTVVIKIHFLLTYYCGVKVTVRLAGTYVGLSIAATASPKSIHSGNGRPLAAPRRLLIVLLSTSLWIVNRCCSGFPVSGGI